MKSKGINGYSLQGPSGFKGKNGKNIFFCAYGINSHNSGSQQGEYEDIVNDFISQRRALSNNSNYIETVDYNDDDIILDTNGDLYIIKNGKIVSEPIGSIYSDEDSDDDINQNEQGISAEWEMNDDVLLENKYNYKATKICYQSPFYIHRDSFYAEIPFHKIRVSVDFGESITSIKYMKVSVVIDKSIEHVAVYGGEDVIDGKIEKEILLDKRYFTSSPNIGDVSGGIPLDDDYEISNLETDAKPENRIDVYIDFVTETERGDITYTIKAEKKPNE